MESPFRDRALTPGEFARFRLMLSTFRDGSGQIAATSTRTSMPGFRDFERTLAVLLGGFCPENKGVFDVEVPAEPAPFGVSCKMSAGQPAANNSVLMELSNSLAKFLGHLRTQQVNWTIEPMLAGPALVDLVTSWHHEVAGAIDVSASRYAVLVHDARWVTWRLACFPLDLKIANPKGGEVTWSAYIGRTGAVTSLRGDILVSGRTHRLWECYLNSGGQLKYFPPLAWAKWVTSPFTLVLPPLAPPTAKAEALFPELWGDALALD